ncbi:hypothetical protein EV426DRAFT_711069 [Tirmania nivea]|nr:hypothetical protein EV426DRAFT_711069 [Tirmania nivea]
MAGRKSIQLRREKEIVSTDEETGGTEESVMGPSFGYGREFCPHSRGKENFFRTGDEAVFAGNEGYERQQCWCEQQGKKRKSKWNVSYSKMTIQESEKRLGVRLNEAIAVPVDRIPVEEKVILSSKEEVYEQIVRYLDIEGYPTEASADFKEAKVSDLVSVLFTDIIRLQTKYRTEDTFGEGERDYFQRWCDRRDGGIRGDGLYFCDGRKVHFGKPTT